MEVIPAVDLMDGKVVRLVRGDPKLSKSYENLGDPISVAKMWEGEGANLIHVVDLDAALGLGSNLDLIWEIVKALRVPVQVGGGVRSIRLAENLLNGGVSRVVLGSLAFNNPQAIKILVEEFGSNRVVVALDHIGGTVVIRGWKTKTRFGVREAMDNFLNLGVKYFLITSINKDGTLMGPDLNVLAGLCGYQGAKVMAAGGIGSLQDLVALRNLGVWGVVVGKALYEGCFTLREAMRAVEWRGG